MFEIIKYSESRMAEWNDFVKKAKNGSFLLDRRYMDYHADRFSDFSLMFYLKGRLYALLPAHVTGDTLYSHQGLTYGGLLLDCRAKTAEVCQLFSQLDAFLSSKGIGKVLYKPSPWIYASQGAEEDLYAIVKVCHATLVGRDVATVIFLHDRIPFSELRRRCMRKGQRQGITVAESEDYAAFWKILDDNLEAKYGVKPVHSCAEIQLLASRFPRNIKLYMACLGEQPLAGVVLFENANMVHVQYISATPEGKRLGALDVVFGELITHRYAHLDYFDFGKSTERHGEYLNEQLIFQKEGFGGRAVCYATYVWTVGAGLVAKKQNNDNQGK